MAPRILVADDSVTIQKVVELTFSKENVTLLQARNGEDAIRKATEEHPDLILLDLVMPDKNGYEVCAAVRAVPMLRAVPIILLTGTFEAFDRDRAVQVGANDFITKPFESQQLISKVRQQLFARTVDTGMPAAPPAAPRPAAPPSAPRPAAAAAVSPVAPLHPEPKEAPPREAPRRPAAAPPRPAPATPAGPAMPASAAKPTGKAPLPTPPERGTPPSASPVGMAAAAPAAAGVPGFVEPPPPPRPAPAREVRAPQRDAPPSPPPPAEPAPSGPAGPTELRLEDMAKVDARPPGLVPEPLSLDDLLGTAERSAPPGPPLEVKLATLPSPPPPPTPPEAPPTGPLGPPSKSVDLDDLLGTATPAGSQAPPVEQAGVQPVAEMPVFDLTADMGGPALPMVEVGMGEPPVLSVEDLIGVDGPKPEPRPERTPLAPGGLSMEPPAPSVPAVEPVVDLTADAGGPEQPAVEVGSGEAPALSVEDLMSGAAPSLVEEPELPLSELEHEPPASSPETTAPPAVTPSPAPEIELEPAFEAATLDAEPLASESAGLGQVESPAAGIEPSVLDLPQEVVEASAAAPLPGLEPEAVFEPVLSEAAAVPGPTQPVEPLASVTAPAAVPGLGAEEIASMRDAVTERVARELARDLSDKLVERIERIVWEVVPEMAEILIAKEIERIRAMADGQNIS
jgi:CheY-like chemotaxis protein